MELERAGAPTEEDKAKRTDGELPLSWHFFVPSLLCTLYGKVTGENQ